MPDLAKQTCLDDTGIKIVSELYKAVSSQTEDPLLLAVIGSWGNTMSDADVLHDLKEINDGGQPVEADLTVENDPEMLQASGENRTVVELMQAIADAVADAQEKGMDLNQALSLVAIAATDYGRVAFGDDYIDTLATTIKMRRGKDLPDSNRDEIAH